MVGDGRGGVIDGGREREVHEKIVKQEGARTKKYIVHESGVTPHMWFQDFVRLIVMSKVKSQKY